MAQDQTKRDEGYDLIAELRRVAAQANADLVATLAKLPWSAFIEGSDKGDTNARPEIWSQADKFKAASQKLEDATVKLAAAVWPKIFWRTP